jgi:uncharacterized protein
MKGAGGTQGGLAMFGIGAGLSILAAYVLFDSVHVAAGQPGLISGLMSGGMPGTMETTSMIIIFVPFFLGVFALFVNASQTWAWILTYFGIGVIAVEILSRIRFLFSMKLTHLMLILVLFAAGCALMFRSYRDYGKSWDKGSDKPQ